MSWIKRNLFFVIGVVVALGLMGFAGFFLFSQIKKDSEMQEQLGSQVANYKALHEKNPFPGQTNIQIARVDQKRIQAFLAEARTTFAPIQPPGKRIGPNDHESFSRLLLTTVYHLQKEAVNASVSIPTNYFFTFSAQSQKTIFAPGSIEPLTGQLAEITEICKILYAARINGIEGLRRTRVSKDDDGGLTTEFLTVNSVTNELAVLTPYEVTIRGFSAELASVMEGFIRAPQCFIVKTVHVETNSVLMETPPSMAAMMPIPVYYQPVAPVTPRATSKPESGMSPEMMRRYGIGSTTRAPAPPTATAPPSYVFGPRQTSNVPVTILRENPLKITLLLEVVKLKPQK